MNGAITSKNLSGAAVTMDPNDPYPGISARPLQMPDFINIKPKNSLVSFRFVNRVAGEGQRLDQMTYAGFVPAKPEDCVMANGTPLPGSLIKDGKVIYGDLICMKIDKKTYDGALKYNWERAVDRLHPNASVRTGQQQLRKTLNESGVGGKVPDLNKKLSVFRPNSDEVAKLEAEEDGSKS